jgi:hypothetical protein
MYIFINLDLIFKIIKSRIKRKGWKSKIKSKAIPVTGRAGL